MQLADAQISPVDMQSRRDIRVSPGDTVRVHQKIVIGKGKTRIQVFEGLVIATKHGTEAGASFTVRRVGTDGIAVEKIYPLYSPHIDAIEVTHRVKMRRSRLYFLRGMTPKNVRQKLRRSEAVNEKTTVESQRKKEEVEVEEKIVADVSTQDVPAEAPVEETAAPATPEEAPVEEAPAPEEKKEEA